MVGVPWRQTLARAVRSRPLKLGLVLLTFLVLAAIYELHINYGSWTIQEEEAKSEHRKAAEAGLMPPGFRAQMGKEE